MIYFVFDANFKKFTIRNIGFDNTILQEYKKCQSAVV